MKRYGMVIKVRPEKLEEYKRLHAKVWPAVLRTISECNIIGNTWDGVALYRGAIATVSDCHIKDGRGVGIGVTWDASCNAFRNEVTGYWKGIGSFGTSNVTARNNLVHRNLGWGIIATGESNMEATNNVVYHNGNCGIAPVGQTSPHKVQLYSQ